MASAEKKTPAPADETTTTDVTTTSSEPTAATTPVAEGSTTPVAESPDDEMRRRYREALERKRSGGPGANSAHGGPKSAAPSSNDKTKRTFRRKSGG